MKSVKTHTPSSPSNITRAGTSTVEMAVVSTMVLVGLMISAAHLSNYLKVQFATTGANLAQQAEDPSMVTRSETASDQDQVVPSNTPNPLEIGQSLAWVIFVSGGVFLFWNSKRDAGQLSEAGFIQEKEQETEATCVQQTISLKRRTVLKAITENFQAAIQGTIEVSQIMTKSPLCMEPDVTRSEIREFFVTKGLHHLLIAKDHELLGMITKHDVELRTGSTAQELMTPNPMTLEQSAPVDLAASMMLAHRFDCLPVLKDGKIVGVVSTSDLLVALQCSLRALQSVTKVLGVESAN